MPVGLYLHYPFCSKICSYCDYCKCNFDSSLEKQFFSALIEETKLRAKSFLVTPTINTIFIGGGTPSLASPESLNNWLSVARECFEFTGEIEFTIECNPNDITLELLEFYKSIGVNRISLGVQTQNKKQLELLGREHTLHDIHQAFYNLNLAEIDNVAVDMLFGFPKQTGKDLSYDIAEIIALEPKHISLYQLTVEENTQIASLVESGKVKMPDSDMLAATMKSAHTQLEEASFKNYELNSYAKENYASYHNLNYWHGGEFIGLGLSAASYINHSRITNFASVESYISELGSGNLPCIAQELSSFEEAEDFIIMSLRLKEGIDTKKFSQLFDMEISEVANSNMLKMFLKTGMLNHSSSYLSMTDKGRYFYDTIISRLLSDE